VASPGIEGEWSADLRAMMAGELTVAVSTEILLEYEEVLTRKFGPMAWGRFTVILDGMSELYGSVRYTDPHFHFHIVTTDPDDNKFTDCAITAEANWMITDDAHFTPLAEAGYMPKPITPPEFIARFLCGR
jgi:putative PIN family toxin of toxin-antitoxin system